MPLFPDTRHSIVAELTSPEPEIRERATGVIVDLYRRPVIAVLEARWRMQRADAEDLAHDFFVQALTHDWLARYDRDRARFRTFLRNCLVAFANSAHKTATRLKRGGGATIVDIDEALGTADCDDQTARLFETEWVRSVFDNAVRLLRSECESSGKLKHFAVFEEIDLAPAGGAERPTYASVGAALELPVTQVTNYLNWSRRRLREHVLDTLRALTTTEAEFREEARSLLGITVD